MSPDNQPPCGTPFILGLAYDLADFRMVRAHWNKNFISRFAAGELVHELMAHVMNQIRADGYVIREYYAFPFDEEISTSSDGLTASERIYQALLLLDRIAFRFEMPALKQYHQRSLLDGTHERHFGNDGTNWTIRFNPALNNYLLNVAQLDEILPPARPANRASTVYRPNIITTSLEELFGLPHRKK